MGSVSYVNDAAPPADEGLVLPGFVEQRADGVYVDLTRLTSGADLERVVDRIFSAGYMLRGLEYDRFQRLLYAFEPMDGLLWLRIASEITAFPEARRSLYRAVKKQDGKAEYLFEPVQLETTAEVPIYGVDDAGEQVVVGVEQKTVYEPTQIDFDEFVAAAWEKGLRFGIDAAKVRELIASGRTERAIIASSVPPTEGVDAGLKEQTETLHRSNAPRRLSDGRVDLQQFANRFPQIREGTRIFLKTPRQLGALGRELDGSPIEPRMPEDFQLDSIAGEGTRVENIGGSEYVLAAIDGFLNLDPKTNTISVTKKIINREGVSARTTGNLALQGDEYEEFGEVQEGRTVEGKNLTFHADVFGHVVSSGGLIDVLHNLVGGSAVNHGGDIAVQGLASSATLHTSAVVRIKRAENCVIVAGRAEIEWAGRCTILADEVELGASEGCVIAGKRVHVGASGSHRGEETLVAMLLPDLSGFKKRQEDAATQLAACEAKLAELKKGAEIITAQPDLQQYLAMAGRLQRKEVTLTPQQQAQWQQWTARMAPALKNWQRAREEMHAVEQEMAAIRERIAQCERDAQTAGDGIWCEIDLISGDTTVQPHVVPLDSPPLRHLPPKDLHARLRNPAPGVQPLFSSASGSFKWANDPGKAD